MTTKLDVNHALEDFMRGSSGGTPGKWEFHQAVREVAQSVMPYLFEHPDSQSVAVLPLELNAAAMARRPSVARFS